MRFFRHGWTLPPSYARRWSFSCAFIAAALAGSARPAAAQRVVRAPEQVVSVSKGASALVVNTTAIQRFSIGDPAVAEAVVVSPTEVLVNGKTLGTTSLFLWDNTGNIKLYSVEVTADAPGLQRYLSTVLAGEKIDVIASGNVVTLSGTVRDASVASRAVEIAKGSGATIVDNLTTPEAVQVLLKVRFAEVNKSAIKEFRSQLATLNPQDLNARTGDWRGSANTDPKTGTFADGVVDLALFNATASIEVLIRALISKGLLKSLAEPNLIALPGREASFLAGGEFPYPTVQGASGNNAVSIVFKEFGIRLQVHAHHHPRRQHSVEGCPRSVGAGLLQPTHLRWLHHSQPSHPAGGDRSRDEERSVSGHRGAGRQYSDRQFDEGPSLGRHPNPGTVLQKQGRAAAPDRAPGARLTQAGAAERYAGAAADW